MWEILETLDSKPAAIEHFKTNPEHIEPYLATNWKDFPPKNTSDIEDLLHFCMCFTHTWYLIVCFVNFLHVLFYLLYYALVLLFRYYGKQISIKLTHTDRVSISFVCFLCVIVTSYVVYSLVVLRAHQSLMCLRDNLSL